LARGPNYRLPYRRRREAKTDYNARRILAISKKPRFVVRIFNKNILIQLVKSEIEGDITLTQVNSSELVKFGWLGGSKNISAAYLLGLFAGIKALENGIEEAILDIGLITPSKGSRVFSAVKGALDAGLTIPCDISFLPDPERIKGSRISEYILKIMEQEEPKHFFSDYSKKGLSPVDLQSHFETVKTNIMGALSK
jgi:large subunit ribosomal protein L18